MVTLITILHIIVCLFLILVVLLQAGKGGGMGLAFGSSGAQTVFGGSGAGNLLTKVTAITAALFMLTSLSLAYFASARQTTWLDDYERDMAAQIAREREQREKLRGATPAEGEEAVDTGEPAEQPETPTSEGGAAPAEGGATAPPAEGTAPTPAPAEGAAPTPPRPAPAPPAPAPQP